MAVPCRVGDASRFRKTVSESDVYLFAGISGDFAPNHVDEEFMRRAGGGDAAEGGGRIAHGALLVAYMSAASTRLYEPYWRDESGEVPVSAGYDRIRFLKPVRLGDTITVSYTISSIDAERGRVLAAIEVHNQRDDLVAVATHLAAFPSRSKLFGDR